MLVLDSGAVSRLSERTRSTLALIEALQEEGAWPPVVPSVVLVECLHGHAARDVNANRFLGICDIVDVVSEPLARRAAYLRRCARRGSAVDALLVATAEPDGTVLTGDPGDLAALAAYARGVTIERV